MGEHDLLDCANSKAGFADAARASSQLGLGPHLSSHVIP